MNVVWRTAIYSVVAVLCLGQPGRGDNPKPAPAKAGKAAKTQVEEKTEKPRKRLPNNYGKLGLSDEQKVAIYNVQATYEDEETRLELLIAELNAKRAAEIEKVLTADQKTKLAEINEAAKKSRAAKSKTTVEEEGMDEPAPAPSKKAAATAK